MKRCLNCGYLGNMTPVLQTAKGEIFVLIGLFFFLVPGIIYIIAMCNRDECPKCRSINNIRG